MGLVLGQNASIGHTIEMRLMTTMMLMMTMISMMMIVVMTVIMVVVMLMMVMMSQVVVCLCFISIGELPKVNRLSEKVHCRYTEIQIDYGRRSNYDLGRGSSLITRQPFAHASRSDSSSLKLKRLSFLSDARG